MSQRADWGRHKLTCLPVNQNAQGRAADAKTPAERTPAGAASQIKSGNICLAGASRLELPSSVHVSLEKRTLTEQDENVHGNEDGKKD
jgi:hypothetical protein